MTEEQQEELVAEKTEGARGGQGEVEVEDEDRDGKGKDEGKEEDNKDEKDDGVVDLITSGHIKTESSFKWVIVLVRLGKQVTKLKVTFCRCC